VSARGLYPALGIGDVTRLFGLTPRSVRFYEERGLVTAMRDRQNHRRYDQSARATLELIAQLRRAGLSIPEIRRLLEARGSGDDLATHARRLLASRRQALTRQLADLEAVDAWLDGAAHRQSSPRRLLARAS
jgi:DNA-binding transcriptional MerR regulator